MNELHNQLQQLLGDTYQLERELTGGMSRVFVAEETALGRKVVIKVLPPETVASVNVARFRREIQLAASLQHPHIVPLLTAGSRGNLLYYVMPLIEGESLRARLVRSGELPVSDVASILRDTASALAYAHNHGVVHRDIKPDNIMLTGNFAVVTDFGVAKAVSEATSDANVTSVGVALGTPTYMAPEQAAADPNTDHRADIYALGVVGYELLAGTPPFTGTSPQMILAAHVTRTPDHVTTHRASVPPALANVIMRCLEKKPADRWQTAEELIQQLAVIATPGASTPHATAPHIAVTPRATTDPPRSRRPAIAAAFVLGLAAFAGVAWFAGRDRSPVFDDHHVIVSDFENQTRDASLDPIGKLASDLLRQAIAQSGVGEVVEAAQAKGDSTRPGLIVRGRYYREGDSVRIQAEVLDARTSRVVRAFSPVTAPASNPSAGLERLRPRVLGALASLNDPLIRNWARKATEPPIYEAYRAYRAGIEADLPRMGATVGTSSADADREFQKAIELDSTFVLPMLEILSPVLKLRYETRDRLTPVDRALVERRQAELNYDWEAAYKAGRRAAELAPDPLLLIQMAGFTIFASRPREALAALKKADPEGNLKFGWGIRTDGLHLTGDLQAELAAVERERQLGLATDFEAAQILPALGRVDEVNALINERMRRPSRNEDTPAALMLFAAREYRAHGFLAASNQLANRALAWYDSRPDAELTEARQENVINTLFHAGRYAEARDRLPKFLPADGGYSLPGQLAAHLGDTAAARGFIEKLRMMKEPTAYARALIAAALGDRDLTYTLLQQAFAEGMPYQPLLHREFDIKAMEDYAPIRELLWPKG